MDSSDRHETLDGTQLRVGERDVFLFGCAHGFLVMVVMERSAEPNSYRSGDFSLSRGLLRVKIWDGN